MIAVLAALLLLVGSELFAPAGARADDFVRHRAHSAAEVAEHVIPPGGIKTTMSGGNSVGGVLREARPRRDGYRHIDTPALIKRLVDAHANMYTFGIWDSPTDWNDLTKEFAPAAARAGIRVMVYLVPPSECSQNDDPLLNGRCSQPYRLDFVEWARQIATLSHRYPNVVAWAIDDFVIGKNQELFTPDYMQKIVDTADGINPDLGFYTTAYYVEATGSSFYERYGPYIDGVIYPYYGGGGTQDASTVASSLDLIRKQTQPRNLSLLLLVYTSRALGAPYPPNETYVNDVFQAAAPYLADGRIAGYVAYAMPVDDKPAMTSDNRAQHGNGRLAFSLCPGCVTKAGQYAQAAQTVRVDPHARTYQISLSDLDRYPGVAAGVGYHQKQVLVDGQVAWESDVEDAVGFSWQRHDIDLTSLLKGKTSATIAIRLYEKQGVGSFPINVGFDDVTARGFSLVNGGFENDSGWKLSGGTDVLHVAVDHYAKDRPARVRAAVAANFAGHAYRTPSFTSKGFRTGDDAMYGHGRLSLSVPSKSSTEAGTCASASQVVEVDPRSPRYELSFWHFDQWDGPPSYRDKQIKTVKIDGRTIFSRDALDPWQYLWLNGHDTQGPIDVTTLVRGKKTVTLEFAVCQKAATTDFPIDVGYDNIESVGLRIVDPGFETGRGWTMNSAGGVTASVKIARQ